MLSFHQATRTWRRGWRSTTRNRRRRRESDAKSSRRTKNDGCKFCFSSYSLSVFFISYILCFFVCMFLLSFFLHFIFHICFRPSIFLFWVYIFLVSLSIPFFNLFFLSSTTCMGTFFFLPFSFCPSVCLS